MDVAWIGCAFSIWLWLYWLGAAIGWGSRKKELVDILGDPKSIFQKMRIILRNRPEWMLPEGFSSKQQVREMRIINPASGSSIVGEAGDDIGRGGRSQVFFIDETAHLGHPVHREARQAASKGAEIALLSFSCERQQFVWRQPEGREAQWHGR
jgi:phage terminase large subunit